MAEPHPRLKQATPHGRRVGSDVICFDCHVPLGLTFVVGGIIGGILTGAADLHAVFDVRRNRNMVRLIRPGNHVPLGPGLPLRVVMS